MYLKRLKELRESRDLLQTDIAKILNTSQQQYSKYELGKRDLPILFLDILATYYKVSTDYILERTNKKEVNR